MDSHPLFLKCPEIKDFIYLLRNEIRQAQRPAHEVVLDDVDVMRILKISKRKLQYLKADRVIPFHTLESEKPRAYYLLSDILDILKENRIESIKNSSRIN